MTRSGPPKPLLECLTSGDVRPIRSASPLLLVASKNVQVNLTDCDKETTMYRILCILMATIGYGAAAVYCQAPQAGTTAITFQSSTYSDFRQLLTREAATGTVTVQAKLDFPEEKKDRYPAVIVVHTLGGYRDANEGYIAAELRKSGFATLTYDSFAARGTTGAAMSASPGYLPAGVADAYAALRRLASEPRIDADRIAIIGFSFGAEGGPYAAFESIRSALNPGPGR